MKTIAAIYRFILASRYDVSVRGENLLKGEPPKLLLPNHQAHVDAQILATQLFKHTRFVPIVSARLLDIPVLRSIFKKLKAVPITNLQSGKVEKDVVGKMTEKATGILKNKGNVLIYPSGQLAGQGFEKIFNKSGAYSIVRGMPINTQVIGVRVSGLWGSMWSKAWTGDIPPIGFSFLKGLFYLLANLLFFVPKRKVTLEFVDITVEVEELVKKDKQAFNAFLEAFYNQDEEENVNFVKHFFYAPKPKRQLPEKIAGSLKELESTRSIETEDIPPEILSAVQEAIIKETGIEKNLIGVASHLSFDLNVDSLGLVFLVTAVENKFGCTFNGDYAKLKTVGDLCLIAMGKSTEEEHLKPSTLGTNNENKKKVTIDPSVSIPDNFLGICKVNPKASLAYDKMMGSNNRKDFLLKVIVVSGLIKKHVKEKHVGIMLPALQSTSLLIMATYFAGKVPVMLNWTVGKKMLISCMESAGLKKVITASSFYDKVEDQLPEDFREHCLFFDREIRKVPVTNKLSALFKSFFPKIFYGGHDPEETAVILFTSGSESQPKGVPLTHKNISYNLWGVLDKLNVYNHDILLGFLPPFHSFGFTVLSIMPMISGVKVAYTPDPKDSREIAKIMHHTKASILLSTPTFLKMIMNAASDKDFKSVRLTITGAESLHPTLVKQFRKKTGDIAQLLQGYGITECSPILSITSSETKDLKSVGRFITGVSHRIIDPESNQILSRGKQGMIVVRGNSIFNGYLNPEIQPPFITLKGKPYYKTGDLGYIDNNGDLIITGRLKRFIKIAGEMISLPAIENALLEKFSSPDEQVLAVTGDDKGDKPEIVLYAKTNITADEANAWLKKQGFSNIMKITRVQQVDEIPVLGTGKTDYKKLMQPV